MLPFPEFGTVPTPGGAAPPAPELVGSGGVFASALRAMFEDAGMGGEEAAAMADSDDVKAGPLPWGAGTVEIATPARVESVEAGHDETDQPGADAALPVAGFQARWEEAALFSAEPVERGQEDPHGKQERGTVGDESTALFAADRRIRVALATGSGVAEWDTSQETSWAPMRSGVGMEQGDDVVPGLVEVARRDGIRVAATRGESPERTPQLPASVKEDVIEMAVRVQPGPGSAQDRLQRDDLQSQTTLKETGTDQETSAEAERSPGRDAAGPAVPDSASGLVMVAAARSGAERSARPDGRPRISEESRSSLEQRGRSADRVRPLAGSVELGRPEGWSPVVENGEGEDPVAFTLRSGIRGAGAEARPEHGRGEQQAVGKLTEVERLAGGAMEGARPEARLNRDGSEEVGTDWPAAATGRDGVDTRENREPGSRGTRDATAPVRLVMGTAGGPVRSGEATAANAGELQAASTPGGPMEGRVSVKQAPAATPANPVVRVEGAVEDLQEARGAVREIRMTVEPERGKPIRLQFRENAGQVEVTARSGDPATAAALRADLGGLRSLGYELGRGMGEGSGPDAARQEAEGGQRGEGGSQESLKQGNAEAGDSTREQKGRNAARWLEAFDRLRDGEWHWQKGEMQ